MTAAHLDKTFTFFAVLLRSAWSKHFKNDIHECPFHSPDTNKHWIHFSFSLPHSYPYTPRAATPTSMLHRSPTPVICLCTFVWKLLGLIWIQIYMDIGIFSMENNSWLFASSYLSFCSQTWISLCHLSSIFHQKCAPLQEEQTNHMGRVHQQHNAPAHNSLTPAQPRQTPHVFPHLTAPPDKAEGYRFLCNTQQCGLPPDLCPKPPRCGAVFSQRAKWRAPSAQHPLTSKSIQISSSAPSAFALTIKGQKNNLDSSSNVMLCYSVCWEESWVLQTMFKQLRTSMYILLYPEEQQST